MSISWWHKILSIPLVVVIYLFAVDFLSSGNVFSSSLSESQDFGGSLNIGFGQAVGVSVTRSYFGGAIQLPIYSGAIGDIGVYHNLFFNYFIYLYSAAMIFWAFAEKFNFNLIGKTKSKAYKQANIKNMVKKRRR